MRQRYEAMAWFMPTPSLPSNRAGNAGRHAGRLTWLSYRFIIAKRYIIGKYCFWATLHSNRAGNAGRQAVLLGKNCPVHFLSSVHFSSAAARVHHVLVGSTWEVQLRGALPPPPQRFIHHVNSPWEWIAIMRMNCHQTKRFHLGFFCHNFNKIHAWNSKQGGSKAYHEIQQLEYQVPAEHNLLFHHHDQHVSRVVRLLPWHAIE